MHGWGSRGTPHPLYAPRTRGGGGTGSKPPKNLPPLEDHLRAKFRPDLSSRLDFYREHTDRHTDTHTDIALYVLDFADGNIA